MQPGTLEWTAAPVDGRAHACRTGLRSQPHIAFDDALKGMSQNCQRPAEVAGPTKGMPRLGDEEAAEG